jgi:ureidoglycolate hydrolase
MCIYRHAVEIVTHYPMCGQDYLILVKYLQYPKQSAVKIKLCKGNYIYQSTEKILNFL